MSGRLSFENLNRKPIGSKRAGMMASQHHFLGNGRFDAMKVGGGASVMNKVQQLVSPRRVPMRDQTNLSFYLDHGATAQRETLRADNAMKQVVATEVVRAQQAYKRGLRGPALSGLIGNDLYAMGKTLNMGNQMYPSDSWNASSLNNPAFREQVDPQVTNDHPTNEVGVSNPSEAGNAGTDWGRYLRGAAAIVGTAVAAYGLSQGIRAYQEGREAANVDPRILNPEVDPRGMGVAELQPNQRVEVLERGARIVGGGDAQINNDPLANATGGQRLASGTAQTVINSAPQQGIRAASLAAAYSAIQSTTLARALAETDTGGNQPGLIGTPQGQAATDMRSVLDMAQSQTLPAPRSEIPNALTPGNQVAGGQGDANPMTTGQLNSTRTPLSGITRGGTQFFREDLAQRTIDFNSDGTPRQKGGYATRESVSQLDYFTPAKTEKIDPAELAAFQTVQKLSSSVKGGRTPEEEARAAERLDKANRASAAALKRFERLQHDLGISMAGSTPPPEGQKRGGRK